MKKYVFKPYSKIFPELFLREKRKDFLLCENGFGY